MQSFGLILYNMSLWTFLFQRSADSCCFFCPKIKLGGESGRGACADYYYFSKRQECTLTPYFRRSHYSRNPPGNGQLTTRLPSVAKGQTPGLHIICVPRGNSGKSSGSDANQMKTRIKLFIVKYFYYPFGHVLSLFRKPIFSFSLFPRVIDGCLPFIPYIHYI